MGELFDILRAGQLVAEVKGWRPEAKAKWVLFPIGIDVRQGDIIQSKLSRDRYEIEEVGEVPELPNFGIREPVIRAFHHPYSPGQPSTVFNVGTMTNSAIQSNSPGATQTLTVHNAGAHEKAENAIRSFLSVLEDLDLDPTDKEEARADAIAAEAMLKSPKPKGHLLRELFTGLRDKLTTGITGKLVEGVVVKAHAARKAIQDYFDSVGGL